MPVFQFLVSISISQSKILCECDNKHVTLISWTTHRVPAGCAADPVDGGVGEDVEFRHHCRQPNSGLAFTP